MEFVYVIKRYDLFDLSFPYGFVPADSSEEVAKYIRRIREKGFFMERRFAENDSSFKQIIPYCIISCGDEALLLKRFSTQGEKRLHNKYSIGVGGHINPVDNVKDFLDAGCERELTEELLFKTGYQKQIAGIINDDSVPVGSVHCGIVFRVDVQDKGVEVREKDMMSAEFTKLDVLKKMNVEERDKFETWSQLTLDKIDIIKGIGNKTGIA